MDEVTPRRGDEGVDLHVADWGEEGDERVQHAEEVEGGESGAVWD